MKKGTVLNVHTLGKLKISCGDIVFPLERQRSAQVELLIIYFFHFNELMILINNCRKRCLINKIPIDLTLLIFCIVVMKIKF